MLTSARGLPTLLIVDDDVIFGRTLKRAMERREFVVDARPSGAETLAVIAENPPNYAIVELRLKHGNGLDLVAEMARLRPQTRTIVLTGYGTVESAVAAAKLGAVDYLAKPTDADSIEAALLGRAAKRAARRSFLRPEEQELNYLLTMYERHDRNMSETARSIGMHRRTLQRILRRHGIQPSITAGVEPVNEKRRVLRLFRLWTRLLAGQSVHDRLIEPAAAE
jgi:two-component system response regulator RegA